VSGDDRWRRDLDGLVSQETIDELAGFVQRRRAQRTCRKRILVVAVAAAIATTVLFVWFLSDWKEDVRADVVNGVVALLLAATPFSHSLLPSVTRAEVDRIVEIRVLEPTLFSIRSAAGVGEDRLEKWSALIASAALLVVIILKNFGTE